jgi:general stress protein 26
MDGHSDSNSDLAARLYDVVKDFDTAVLVTNLADGRTHARPMAVAEVRRDGDIVFATDAGSPKVAEIAANPDVVVTFQGKNRFAAIAGRAAVLQDRALVEKLWSEMWRVWFPGGKDDPKLCLIRVAAQEGEYWDNAGAQGIKYVYEAAKAYATGTTPDQDARQNAKVKL